MFTAPLAWRASHQREYSQTVNTANALRLPRIPADVPSKCLRARAGPYGALALAALVNRVCTVPVQMGTYCRRWVDRGTLT